MPGTFPTSDEDDISLTGADVVALQKEELVDSVVLQCGNFDNSPDRTGETLLDYKILLALDLDKHARRVNQAEP